MNHRNAIWGVHPERTLRDDEVARRHPEHYAARLRRLARIYERRAAREVDGEQLLACAVRVRELADEKLRTSRSFRASSTA